MMARAGLEGFPLRIRLARACRAPAVFCRLYWSGYDLRSSWRLTHLWVWTDVIEKFVGLKNGRLIDGDAA